jgi:Fic family protein
MDKRQRIGNYISSRPVGGESFRSYIPKPLPPDPEVDLSKLYPLLDRAMSALGRLDGMSMVLPDPSLFLYMYVRKEAVLSSQIEGTQSSLSDLLMYEAANLPGAPLDDVTEVSCYVRAMSYGLERLKELPLSSRLLREIHQQLMYKARGGMMLAGEFRTSQNWIGGTRPGNAYFVPPPAEYVMECMGDLEKFLHDEKHRLPALIKAAMAHVQFETIHPFLDGNGRLGRLLITFILCAEGILREPLLYLSLYFKINRSAYYEHLQTVRTEGAWEEWLQFFLNGVIDTATQATQTAQQIIALFKRDLSRIEEVAGSSRVLLQIYSLLQRHPFIHTAKVRHELGVSLPTALRHLKRLEDLGIIRETTGKNRNKQFAYLEYIHILNEGTEIPAQG